MKTSKIHVAFGQKLPAITCDCGEKFIVLYIIENLGEKIEAWPQERIHYCPYCGCKEHDWGK